jgi:acyl carrier protein
VNTQAAAVTEAIYKALAALNEERSESEQIPINEDTCLFGEGSALDSLSLVSVIVDLETMISDQFDKPISLTDDRAMGRDPVPFVNVTALRAYLLELLAE